MIDACKRYLIMLARSDIDTQKQEFGDTIINRRRKQL